MKVFSATTIINAAPENIWRILTDAPNYPRWDPGIDHIEGMIAAGNQITAYTKYTGSRAFPVKVSEFVPAQKMVWSSGMPLGLFKGVRTFTLTPKGTGRTEFSLREEFSGLLLPMIGRSLPDLNKTFAEFAAGLKAYAEKS